MFSVSNSVSSVFKFHNKKMTTEKDIRRLNLLGILHYVLGGITTALAFIGTLLFLFLVCFWTGMGLRGDSFPDSGRIWTIGMSAVVSMLFSNFGVSVLLGWCLAICMLKSGRKLRARKGRIFSMVVAGLQCVTTPFFFRAADDAYRVQIILALFCLTTTMLGTLTLITLNKQSIKELYKHPSLPPSP